MEAVVDVTVRIYMDIPDDADIDEIIEDMDYTFKPATSLVTFRDTDLYDMCVVVDERD